MHLRQQLYFQLRRPTICQLRHVDVLHGLHSAFSGQMVVIFSKVCRRANQSPTLYPQTSVHYQCKLVQAIASIMLVRIAPDIPAGDIDQLQMLLSHLVEEGRRWPEERERGLEGLIKAIAASVPIATAEATA